MQRGRLDTWSGIWAVLGLGALAGCATTTQPTWGDRESNAPGDSVEVAPPPKTKMSADELARSLASADRCLALAEENDQQSQRKGWILAQACARRPDFVDLDALLRSPWLKRVQGTPEGSRLLAHVVAHRGGKVLQDLEPIQAKKVPLLSLEQATATPGAPEGAAVLLRGRIVEIKGADKDWLLVVDEVDFLSDLAAPAESGDEEQVKDDDEGDDLGALDEVDEDAAEPPAASDEELVLRGTGRRVLIQADALEPSVKVGLSCVAQVRYRGVQQPCAGPVDKSIRVCVGGTLSELLVHSGEK